LLALSLEGGCFLSAGFSYFPVSSSPFSALGFGASQYQHFSASSAFCCLHPVQTQAGLRGWLRRLRFPRE